MSREQTTTRPVAPTRPHPVVALQGDHRPHVDELRNRLEALGFSVVAADVADPSQGKLDAGDVLVCDLRSEQVGRYTHQAADLCERAAMPLVVICDGPAPGRQRNTSMQMHCQVLSSPFSDADLAVAVEVAAVGWRLRTQSQIWTRWFRAILAGTNEPVLATDRSGQIQFVGEAAASILGSRADAIEGKQIDQMLASILDPRDHGACMSILKALVGEAPPWDGPVTLVLPGGPSPGRVSARPVLNDSGACQGGLVFVNLQPSATAFPPAREAVWAPHQATSDEQLLALVAAGVGHRLNNSLQVMIGHAELIAGGLPGKRARTASLDAIRTTAIRASRHVERLIEFTRAGTAAPACVELDQVLQAAVDRWTPKVPSGVCLKTGSSARGARVLARAADLDRILDALLANALEAMPPAGEGAGAGEARGTISVSVERVGGGSGVAPDDASEERPGWALVVSDTGTGIDPETRAHLFEPFYTTRARTGARGLGLAAAYELVQRAGGRIEVESHVGQGSTFRIRLAGVQAAPEQPSASAQAPVASEPPPRPAESELPAIGDAERSASLASPPTVAPAVTGWTVLVVDDDDLVVKIVRKQLRLLGYEVTVANDGPSALERLADREHPVDLMLTDIVMPGIDGVELARRARGILPHLPVVYMTGYLSPSVKETISADSRAAYLDKPFHINELDARLREMLALSPPDPPAAG